MNFISPFDNEDNDEQPRKKQHAIKRYLLENANYQFLDYTFIYTNSNNYNKKKNEEPAAIISAFKSQQF